MSYIFSVNFCDKNYSVKMISLKTKMPLKKNRSVSLVLRQVAVRLSALAARGRSPQTGTVRGPSHQAQRSSQSTAQFVTYSICAAKMCTLVLVLFLLACVNLAGTGLLEEDPTMFVTLMLENIRDSLPFAAGDRREIDFKLYTRENPVEPIFLDRMKPEDFRNTTFRVGKPVTIIIHGFGATGEDAFATFTKNALLRYADWSVLIVDWGELARGTLVAYPLVMRRSKFVAEEIADFLEDGLQEHFETKFSDIHFIGLSLGANIASLAARKLSNSTKDGGEHTRIRRITALDPTLLFSFDCDGCRGGIHLNDAQFIDVIHTNTWAIGVKDAIGHADFYPNGGLIQPGCPSKFSLWNTYDLLHCPHVRAWMFYLESINHPYDFIGWPCQSWENFKTQNCSKGRPQPMGYHTPFTARGSYFLHTKEQSPFGNSFDGFS